MKEENLFTIYRKCMEKVKRVKINTDDISEEEFVATYTSDPFFQERVNVELEKLLGKLEHSQACSTNANEKDDGPKITTLRK